MEIRHLRLVKAVAEKGNLSKAVEQLNVSASALSHQLKEVEKELNLRLFHRVNKKLVLTEAGSVLLASANRILNELTRVEQDLENLREGKIGNLKITTECYTCYHWLPRVLSPFSKSYPQINISIHPEYTHASYTSLIKGEVDMVITSNLMNNPLIKYQELFRDEQLAIVGNKHPWAKKAFVEAKDFKDEHIIIYSGPLETVWLFTHLLIPKNIKPAKITELKITEAQIEMIKVGYGVTAMAEWIIAPFLNDDAIKAIPISQNGLFRKWYLASRKSDPVHEFHESFVESLVNQMKVSP